MCVSDSYDLKRKPVLWFYSLLGLLLGVFMAFRAVAETPEVNPVQQGNGLPSPIILGNIFTPPLAKADGKGLLDNIAREAFSRAGIPLEIQYLPPERSILNANAGIIDGDILRIGDIDRLYPNLVQVPETILRFDFVAFCRTLDLKTDSWESIYPYSIGIIRGWKILEVNTARAASVTKVRNATLLFKLLDNNRADLVLYERLEGYGMIKNLSLENIRVLDPPLAQRDMFMFLHKKHARLAPVIAAALRDMKADGSFNRIVDASLEGYLPEGEQLQ